MRPRPRRHSTVHRAPRPRDLAPRLTRLIVKRGGNAMHDVEVIEDPAAAAVALDPIRARLLHELVEPGSAAALAGRVGIARQRVRYHLKALEAHGLLELVEERRWGGITERVMRATAANYVVSPPRSANPPSTPATADRLSARHLSRWPAAWSAKSAPSMRRGRGREAAADDGDRHRDPIPIGRGSRRVRRRPHRCGARSRRSLPPRRWPTTSARRRGPPVALHQQHHPNQETS